MGRGGICRQNTCYHAAAFGESLPFDMQQYHVLKKLNFDQLTPSPGFRLGVCGQNICFRVAAFLILFNLICKKFDFDRLTLTAESGGRGGVCGKNYCYHAAAFGDSL